MRGRHVVEKPAALAARRLAAAAMVAAVAIAALSAIVGGLLRAGVAVPGTAGAPWLGPAALHHAALIVCGFMGTVIGIERAVALRHVLAWSAPALSALAGMALLTGATPTGAGLMVAAAVAFTFVNAWLVHRQPAPHTALLLGSALAWLAGNVLFAAGAPAVAVVPWWFGFLVVTIAAERLEMTRLMRRRPGASGALWATLAVLGAGAVLSSVDPVIGGVLYGLALLLLAAWLLAFDIARRTLFTHGLSRYMAVCLLGGYLWLGLSGIAWAGTALGLPLRDAALHALGLGFVLSMMMGHAPVILPAVARVKLAFGAAFYLPLALLHVSLALRLGPGLADASWRALGAWLNAAAIALFAATAIGAALAWRHAHPVRERARPA